MTTDTLASQRALFDLEVGEAYLNGASRSPQLKAGADAARYALAWRETNYSMPIPNFFEPVDRLKASFAKLVNGEDPDRVAIIPSASYGLATVAKNLPVGAGRHIIVVEDQFPSNYYPWVRCCEEKGGEVRTVARPAGAGAWSDAVLEAIDDRTAAVAIGNLHWADGTLFDLEAIRRRTEEVGAWLVIDGTQSVGALPFNMAKIRPDALVVAGYKWLFGPYGTGFAYYGARMDDGVPLEENWINRAGSDDFRNLVNYRSDYRPQAGRYSVGEHSNFIFVPMLQAALDQLNTTGPDRVQAYTEALWADVVPALDELGVGYSKQRAHHLVGLQLPAHIDRSKLAEELARRRVTVSYRGDAVRVSPNVYNGPDEMGLLVEALRQAVG